MYYINSLKMQHANVVLNAMLYALGIPVTILGIIENVGTWKADVLFFLSGIFLFARLIWFIIDKNQQRQKRDMDLERQKYDNEKHMGKNRQEPPKNTNI